MYKFLREKIMEEGDSVWTVECLRGRLLAERVASRNAKEEADQLGTKVLLHFYRFVIFICLNSQIL